MFENCPNSHYQYYVVWSRIVCCLHLKIEFRSCAKGRQWCGIFHYHWWTASIKPRLLFFPCRLCFLMDFPFISLSYSNIQHVNKMNIWTHFVDGSICRLFVDMHIHWRQKCNTSQRMPKMTARLITKQSRPRKGHNN